MVELTRFWKFLLVSNILFFLSCESQENECVNEMKNIETIILTREDSVLQLAKDLNISYDPKTENINEVLNKILISKTKLILSLDSLDKRADNMESAAIQYKKKENIELKRRLLSEIDRIKSELNRIKKLSGLSDSVIIMDSTLIPENKIPEITSTLENLPSGNYITRIDKYTTVSIFITANGKIIFGEPKLDSTTIIRSKTKLDGRISKEIKQYKNKIKN